MSLLDTARGAYVRSPRIVRRTAAPFLAMIPARLKFGATYRNWRQRIARAATDPDYAAAQQLASLRALLAKAHAGSPFYRDLIERAFGSDFDAAAIEIGDIERLPILDKRQLRAAGERALAVPRWQVDIGETSGSNAEKPFRFYLDKDRSAREMAFVYDAWASTGYTENDARACLRGMGVGAGNQRLHEWDPALRELRLSAFPLTREDVDLYLDLIDARAIRYIYGYPSSVELMCRHMRSLGRRPRLPIKGLLLISEPVFDHQRRTFADVLGDIPIACFYGLSEKALFGTEVAGQPGIYEFSPLYGLAELVDENGQPITEPGQEGRLIGTSFLTTGMPFIRYDTGDFARLVERPNAQNGQRLRIEALTPRRKPDYLIAADGNRVVTVDLTPENPRVFNGIDEFQFYQKTPGKVLIRYIPAPEGSAADAERLANYLWRRTRGRISFSTQKVDRIASGRGGKRAFIEQQLDLAHY